MFELYCGMNWVNFFDPYDVLPVERVVTCLGERR